APLLAEIARRHAGVTAVTLASDASLAERTAALAAVHDADRTLLVTLNAHRDPAQLALARAAIAAGDGRIIGLAAANPYDASALPELGTLLLTYEYTAPALAAAVRVLFGEAPALGHAPVTLAAPASGE
ncbi:MAG TPA: hypothetical protein VGN32_10695, partial [Ktedonobacterales bacterium]|nr:hypothetical protein [Ktedonobacterales bacterium]